MPREFILNFHGLGDPGRPLEPGEEQFWVPVERFEAILDNIVTPSGSRVSITFDDGNDSDLEIALPRLLARHLTARFFVLAGRLDSPRFLSRSAIRELRSAGMTVGSHGYHHVNWRRAPEEVLARELDHSRNTLSELLGRTIDEIAIPYGAYDSCVLRWLKRYGYKAVYTSDGGSCRSGAWLRPRTCITRNMPLIDIERLVTRASVASDVVQYARLYKRRVTGVGSVAISVGSAIL